MNLVRFESPEGQIVYVAPGYVHALLPASGPGEEGFTNIAIGSKYHVTVKGSVEEVRGALEAPVRDALERMSEIQAHLDSSRNGSASNEVR